MKYVLLICLALVGCGGGDYEEEEKVEIKPPINCAIDPRPCL